MTSRNPAKLIPADFVTTPAVDWLEQLEVRSADAPAQRGARAVLLAPESELPAEAHLDWATLKAAGFEAKANQAFVIAQASEPHLLLVGTGVASELTAASVRDLAASAARAGVKFAELSLELRDRGPVSAEAAAAALAEGAVLARYRYTQLQAEPGHVPLERVRISIAGSTAAELASAIAAAEFGVRATCVARDLTNTPPGHLTATNLADAAVELAGRFGFEAEVFGKAEAIELGLGGLLGVNQGSIEDPRMVKLSWAGSDAAKAKHLAFVGKGIMYDSGGINLKPSDPMHLLMKMDMAGAAALIGLFCAARDAAVPNRMTAWLMCTDNMPSGSAYKMGDVLHARNGKSVEVRNTDAEGRLVMMDGLSLAVEAEPDAIVDIATLTGNALLALGELTAALFSNNDALAAELLAASAETGEQIWRMPIEPKHRKQLDSRVADLGNVGGKYAGAGIAALFLQEFVAGKPWAHLDIAGTMQTDSDDAWRPNGATGFGARLLLDVAQRY